MKITYEYTSDRANSSNHVVRATLANEKLSATLEAPTNPEAMSFVHVEKTGTNGRGSMPWIETRHKSVPFKLVSFSGNGDGELNDTEFLYQPRRVNVPDAIPDHMVQEAAQFLKANKDALHQLNRVLRTPTLIEAVPTHIEAGGTDIPVEVVPYTGKANVRGA